MIKASAGGGGKGMRIAWNDKEVRYSRNILKSVENRLSDLFGLVKTSNLDTLLFRWFGNHMYNCTLETRITSPANRAEDYHLYYVTSRTCSDHLS